VEVHLTRRGEPKADEVQQFEGVLGQYLSFRTMNGFPLKWTFYSCNYHINVTIGRINECLILVNDKMLPLLKKRIKTTRGSLGFTYNNSTKRELLP